MLRLLRILPTHPRLAQLPPLPPLPPGSFTEVFLKGSGPGGQKINKTSSAVQLRHLPSGIVVKSQISRSRDWNRAEARRVLREKVGAWAAGLAGEETRGEVRAQRERTRKERAGRRCRAKYRALEEGKAGEDGKLKGCKAGADGRVEGSTSSGVSGRETDGNKQQQPPESEQQRPEGVTKR